MKIIFESVKIHSQNMTFRIIFGGDGIFTSLVEIAQLGILRFLSVIYLSSLKFQFFRLGYNLGSLTQRFILQNILEFDSVSLFV